MSESSVVATRLTASVTQDRNNKVKDIAKLLCQNYMLTTRREKKKKTGFIHKFETSELQDVDAYKKAVCRISRSTYGNVRCDCF